MTHNNCKYKKVMLPVLVPNSDYCLSDKVICPYLDAEGVRPFCELKLGPIDYEITTFGLIKKSDKCKALKPQ